jgi:glucan phosphoethanolaminetransferase (alkaline phosphatase superfamily)
MNRIFLIILVAISIGVFSTAVVFLNVMLINSAGTFGMVAVPFVILLTAYLVVYVVKKLITFLNKPEKA